MTDGWIMCTHRQKVPSNPSLIVLQCFELGGKKRKALKIK